MEKILVIGDVKTGNLSSTIELVFEGKGHQVLVEPSECDFTEINYDDYRAIIIDLEDCKKQYMKELERKIEENFPEIPIIVLTENRHTKKASNLEAEFEFPDILIVYKPFSLEELEGLINGQSTALGQISNRRTTSFKLCYV